jgi:hypothetical protein
MLYLVRQWPFGLSNPVTASRSVTFIRPQMALLLLILELYLTDYHNFIFSIRDL